MEIKDRITKIIKSKKLTSSKFADIIGVQRSSISHILSGRNKPSLDFIQKILNNFQGINTDWLLFGKGEMYRESSAPKTLFDQPPPVSSKKQDKKEDKSSEKQDSPSKKEEKKLISSSHSLFTHPEGKKIEKIVLFYTDKTFTEYNSST